MAEWILYVAIVANGFYFLRFFDFIDSETKCNAAEIIMIAGDANAAESLGADTQIEAIYFQW